jgi:hypothetical protein
MSRPSAALGLDGEGMDDPSRTRQKVTGDLVSLWVVPELPRRGVIPADSDGDGDRRELGAAPRSAVGGVDQPDLELVPGLGDGDSQPLAGRYLPVPSGQPDAVLVVDRGTAIPALARDAERSARSRHVVDQSLGHGHVGLPGDRRVGSVDSG